MYITRILSINPGSTSTKIAVYDEENQIMEKVLRHSNEEIAKYPDIYSQKEFRKKLILEALEEFSIPVASLSAVVGRGGLLKPISGGTYLVTEKMVEDLKNGISGEHASNLGGVIAKEIADQIDKKAYIVDPVVVDEMESIAKLSGIPEISRKSIFHALNQKAVSRKYCKEKKVDYKNQNLIVVHMGGGISIGIHSNGKVIDVNNALDGDGPFTPERAGTIPAGQLLEMCFSEKYDESFIKKRLKGNGGIVAYLGTNDVRDVEKMIIDGNEKAKLILDAMVYQIAKEVGGMATVVSGEINAIILTGGISYSKYVVKTLEERIKFIAPVTVYPGEDEMSALAMGGLRVLNREEEAKRY